MKKTSLVSVALAALGLAAWLILTDDRQEARPVDAKSVRVPAPVDAAPSPRQDKVMPSADAAPSPRQTGEDAPLEGSDEDTSSADPEEQKAAAEEAAVESFDNLTDKWMEPSEKGVTMADVDAFVREFKKVPKDRQEECLQRALNLVPDENVMLLAGVLMDKSQPKELVELVFNDVLNRDESVKSPILQQIIRDKSHPCWADTAWILDATGETSGNTATGR